MAGLNYQAADHTGCALFALIVDDLGLNAGNVITFGISPELSNYTPQQSRALFERVEDELAAVPGVTGVTASRVSLIAGSNWSVFLDRLITTLSAAFAVLATLLAAVGLYGVLAYTLAQRTREFGVRMALGADGGRVRRLVLRQVGWMTLVGGAIGLLAAIGLGRFAQALLFDLEGHDSAALVAAAALLALVALGAGFIPAFRASRIDPMQARRAPRASGPARSRAATSDRGDACRPLRTQARGVVASSSATRRAAASTAGDIGAPASKHRPSIP